MSRLHHHTTTSFCQDDQLGYQRGRTQFLHGKGLMLDEAYRCAHLPLVAPEHPSVIPTRTGSTYNMGRHDRMFSLVLPIPTDALLSSNGYQELERELRAACFAPKIAWDLLQQRKDKLHATVCGSLSVGEAPSISELQRQGLAQLGPIRIEFRGLFSGDVNVGRLYLRVYPEQRNGQNICQGVQRTLNRPQTDVYLVGVSNLTDDLDAIEASALNELLQQWWNRPLIQFDADHLWLLALRMIWFWMAPLSRQFR